MSERLPFEGILLISDMDKTLVTEKFTVPQRNIDAINRFIKKGGHFSLATGRSAESAGKYLKHVPVNAPCILSNGASIYDFDKREILWNAFLPATMKDLLIRVMERFPHIGIEVYRNEKIYIVNSNVLTENHIVDEGIEFKKCLLSDIPEGWQKVLFAGENSELMEVDDFIKGIGFFDCDFVFSNTIYYEALPKNISKGTAIPRLAHICGIDKKNTIAIGDYFNDLTLVKMSGYGATVEGAPEELIEAADFVAGKCDGGAVADLIEHIEKSPRLFA